MMDNVEIERTFRARLLSADRTFLRLLRDGYEGRMADLYDARSDLAVPLSHIEDDESHEAVSDAVRSITNVIGAHQTVIDEIDSVLDEESRELCSSSTECMAFVH